MATPPPEILGGLLGSGAAQQRGLGIAQQLGALGQFGNRISDRDRGEYHYRRYYESQQAMLNQHMNDAMLYGMSALQVRQVPPSQWHKPRTFREELQDEITQWLKNSV